MSESHPWNSYSSKIGLVILTGSAGSLEGFRTVLSRLPAAFPAPVLVCQHRWSRPGEDSLVKILRRYSHLQVIQAEAGIAVSSGCVYVAPPNRHLFFQEGRIVLCEPQNSTENRPSADLLLGSVASHFGGQVIAVVLSGSLSDGAVGVVKIKASGGRVIVQEPLTASSRGMPSAAIASGCADFILPLNCIADAITALTMVPGATELFPSSRPSWASAPI